MVGVRRIRVEPKPTKTKTLSHDLVLWYSLLVSINNHAGMKTNTQP